jgi:hypothetical protein
MGREHIFVSCQSRLLEIGNDMNLTFASMGAIDAFFVLGKNDPYLLTRSFRSHIHTSQMGEQRVICPDELFIDRGYIGFEKGSG